jgi:hypothetical protein
VTRIPLNPIAYLHQVLGYRKERDDLNEAYHLKLEENERAAEERTAKKRQKEKMLKIPRSHCHTVFFLFLVFPDSKNIISIDILLKLNGYLLNFNGHFVSKWLHSSKTAVNFG